MGPTMLTKQLTVLGRRLHAETLPERALLPRRITQTFRPKSNDTKSVHCSLPAFMNHRPGITARSRLTTWRTSSL